MSDTSNLEAVYYVSIHRVFSDRIDVSSRAGDGSGEARGYWLTTPDQSDEDMISEIVSERYGTSTEQRLKVRDLLKSEYERLGFDLTGERNFAVFALVSNPTGADDSTKHPSGASGGVMTTPAEGNAQVITYDNVGMLATARCDRCGAQAYVEVALDMDGDNAPLLFCASHATQAWPKLITLNAMISDHRPFLQAQASEHHTAAKH